MHKLNTLSRGTWRFSGLVGDSAALTLDFLAGVLDPRITFTRATTATYFGSDGLMKTAAVDAPRFDYDPVTLQPKGLLIEGPRTNAVAVSRDYASAYWGRNITGSLTITSNTDAALDGTMSADRFDAAAESCGVYRVGVHTGLAISDAVSMTLLVKPLSGYCKIRIGYSGTAFTTAQQGVFDLIAGTEAVYGAANVRKMVPLPNGYWLITLTATATAAGDASVSIYSHDSTPQSFCVDHLQSEVGAFATSIIPTTTSPVSRAGESAMMTGTNFSDWFNPLEGAFVVEASTISNSSAGIFAAQNAGITHLMRVARQFGKATALVNTAGVDQASLISGNNFVSEAVSKSALVYAANDFALALNGGAVVTDAAGTVPTVDRLILGAGGFSTPLFGHIRRLQYYRTRLPNSELQRLAT